MARDITSGFQTEIEAKQLSPLILVKAEFDGGHIRFWTGINELEFNNEIYVGSGALLTMERIEETEDLIANKVAFELTGIPSSLVSLALNEPYQGRKISTWFGVLDNSGQLIANPYQTFSGFMDVMNISDNGEVATITINAENELIGLRESKERRYTPEDQKAIYNNDLGLDFIPKIQDVELTFGAGRAD